MRKLLFVFGTRPEAIKMAPLIKAFEQYPENFSVKVCVTAQHREMLDQVLDFFQLVADYDLNLMQANQSLFDITINCLTQLQSVFDDARPDTVFVQGDTTTTFIGALAAYYFQTEIAHLEAGLRSGDKYSPFPEEGNRILASHIADYHFAPTTIAKNALAREGITENVWVVGNTVIDALQMGLKMLEQKGDDVLSPVLRNMNFAEKVVLITGHRRESFGLPFENVTNAIKTVAECHNDVQFIYPVHLNPNVRQPVNSILGNLDNVHLIEPLDYPSLIWLMNKSSIVLTDSGGIQEEAPALGKPVLVTRDVTERMEGVDAGTAKLVGTNHDEIVKYLNNLLDDEQAYQDMANAINPYGDGTSSQQIVEILRQIDTGMKA